MRQSLSLSVSHSETSRFTLCINSVPIPDKIWFSSFSQIRWSYFPISPKMYISVFHSTPFHGLMQSATRCISRSPAHVTLPHTPPSYHQSESSLPPIPNALEGSTTLWTIVDQSDSMSQIKIFVFVYLSVFLSVQRVQGISRNIFYLMKDCY